jgi:hypothetical protein
MFSLESANRTNAQAGQAYQRAIDYGIDVCQLEHILALTHAERLSRHDAALALVLAAREAGIRYYGFDPRSLETPE